MALAQLAPATRQRDAAVTHAPARLAYIDNLRALVIAMVIVHHAAQPYGPTGGNWPIANPTRAAILEPFFIVNAAFGLGLLVLFREHGDYQGVLARELAATSYAVYIIHIFPVIGLQVALAESALPPLAKFGLVALLALPLCFSLAYGLRKLPGVRRVV